MTPSKAAQRRAIRILWDALQAKAAEEEASFDSIGIAATKASGLSAEKEAAHNAWRAAYMAYEAGRPTNVQHPLTPNGNLRRR